MDRWKTTVTVYGIKKKELHVGHVLVRRIRNGLVFVEIDFNGDHRPVFVGSGHFEKSTSLTFDTNGKGDKTGVYIDVEIETPKDLYQGNVYGQINKRTWRGFIVGPKVQKRIYDDPPMIWNSFVDKPKRRFK
jgi:hypothetical protein